MRRMPPGLETDAAQAADAGVVGTGHAVNHGQIAARNGMRLELGGKAVMGAVGFGDDQKAGRVLVDAVHDAGAPFAPDA